MGDNFMNNIISYYYDLHPQNIINRNNKYFFEYNNRNFIFERFERPINDIDGLYKINKEMIVKNILFHEIIKNKENKIVTYINNIPYVLLEYFVNLNKKITLEELKYINDNSINLKCDEVLYRTDWINLWKIKNDYFETQINEISRNFPIVCSYVNYYIGLAENAISYMNNISKIEGESAFSISHKRIDCNETLYSLYHPFNLIYDYKTRDLGEFIKSCFFYGENVYYHVQTYFFNNFISYKEALIFYARLLYPSYFFDLYDDIVNTKREEKEIFKIILKQEEYEKFLIWINMFLSRLYNRHVPTLDWLIKKVINR